MKKYLKEHIQFMENVLEKDDHNWEALLDFHRARISFFQHERLIHLLVTFFFGLLLLSLILIQILQTNVGFLIEIVILLIMLGFYIWHYFILENGVQKMYRLDKEIMKRTKKIKELK